MANRHCFHADGSFQDRETGAFNVVQIIEGEAGYYPSSLSYHRLTDAQVTARTMNTQLGLTAEDVLEIRASSMRASR